MARDSTGDTPIHPTDMQAASAVEPKALLRLVKVLGVILVLLFMGLIGGIIWKATHRAAQLPTPNAPAQLNFSGAEVLHMALDGNHLAITSSHQITVIDIRTGQEVMVLPLK